VREDLLKKTNIEKEDLSRDDFQSDTRQLVVLGEHKGGLPRAAIDLT
jgi:hypothetical protein